MNTRICPLCECTVAEIKSYNGEKYIHFLGYGVEASGSCPAQLVEYCGFEALLSDVLRLGFSEYEKLYGPENKIYIKDYQDEFDLLGDYQHFDNGYVPKMYDISNLSADTPEGMYIFCPHELYAE